MFRKVQTRQRAHIKGQAAGSRKHFGPEERHSAEESSGVWPKGDPQGPQGPWGLHACVTTGWAETPHLHRLHISFEKVRKGTSPTKPNVK